MLVGKSAASKLSLSLTGRQCRRVIHMKGFGVGQSEVALKVLEATSYVCPSLLKWRLIGLTYKVVLRNKHGEVIYVLLWIFQMRVLGQIQWSV